MWALKVLEFFLAFLLGVCLGAITIMWWNNNNGLPTNRG